MTNIRLQVGKITSRGAKYPWEPGYVASVEKQVRELTDILRSICDQFGDVTPEICRDALEPTFEKSKVYCPKDTHRLVNSGYLEITGFRGQPRVEMGYAKGGDPHYAVLVHENLNMHHQPPTQAKFLQRAVEEDLPDIAVRIGEGFRTFMNG